MTRRVKVNLDQIIDDLAEIIAAKVSRPDIARLVTEHLAPRSKFDQHLIDTAEPWTSGATAPPCVQSLIKALIEIGADGLAIPRCSACDKERLHRYSVDGKRVCTSCYEATRHLPCSRCGKERRVYRNSAAGPVCTQCHKTDPSTWRRCGICDHKQLIVSTADGVDCCKNCYSAPPRICSGCGRSGRVVSEKTGEPLCQDCYQRPKRACGVCGEVAVVNQRATADSPDLCGRCYRRPLAVCDACGEYKMRHKRVGDDRYLCKRCTPRSSVRRSPTLRECAECGRSGQIVKVDNGRDICSKCYDASRVALCSICGHVAKTYYAETCMACSLERRLAMLFGSPDPDSPLGLFHRWMLATDNPRSLLRWTVKSPGAQLMVHFADHGIEPTHQTLDEINEDYVPHLRSMLVAAGSLPKQDKHVASFERWLARTLGSDSAIPNAANLRAFATWELLPRLRSHARNGTATDHHDKNSRTMVRQAIKLIEWLSARKVALEDLDQPLLEQWLTENATTAYHARSFISWCEERRITKHPLEIPLLDIIEPAIPADSDQRWATVDRLLSDDQIPLQTRVAGVFVILYGQHISRVAILTLDQIGTTEHGTTIQFGDTPVQLPPRVAELAEALAQQPRPTLNSPEASPTWLFPGRRPGEHRVAERLRTALNKHGITCRPNRNGALIDLASELPAPMLADLLGIHPGTARRWSRRAKGDWTAYIGDRTAEQFPPE